MESAPDDWEGIWAESLGDEVPRRLGLEIGEDEDVLDKHKVQPTG